MTLLAISDDDREASVRFARDLSIPFDLLADTSGAVAGQYVGRDEQGNALPGVVLVDPSGSVVFRQIGERKDDRLGAAALLALIDRIWGPVADAAAPPLGATTEGFAPDRRLQLRAELGGGLTASPGREATASLGAAVLAPLGRALLLGPSVHAEARGAFDLTLEASLRLPVLPSVGWAYLAGAGGYTVGEGRGAAARGAVGVQLAFDPGHALHLELSATWRDASEHSPTLLVSIGVARLLQLHD